MDLIIVSKGFSTPRSFSTLEFFTSEVTDGNCCQETERKEAKEKLQELAKVAYWPH